MKDYVALEQAVCPVCGETHDTGVLLDRRLRKSLESPMVTHYALCKEHQRLFDEGYVAVVGVDPEKSAVAKEQTNLQVHEAYRTGDLVHVREEAFRKLFDVPVPDGKLVYCEPQVVDFLKEVHEHVEA